MGDNILDELIAMAEQLQCQGPDPEDWNAHVEKCMQQKQILWPLPLRCPHCMMLKRLRQLKAEAEQFAKGYGQTRRYLR
jgi:hypothetical protein